MDKPISVSMSREQPAGRVELFAESPHVLNQSEGFEKSQSDSPLSEMTQQMKISAISTTKRQKLMTDYGHHIKTPAAYFPKRTPKRNLDFVNEDSPQGTVLGEMAKPHACAMDTPTSYESPSQDFLRSRKVFTPETPTGETRHPLETLHGNIPTNRTTLAKIHRVNSVPDNMKLQHSAGKENASTWERSYSTESDASSLDSGIGLEKDRENDFTAPQGRPPKRRTEIFEVCSDEPLSPPSELEHEPTGFSSINFRNNREGSDSASTGQPFSEDEDGFPGLEDLGDTVLGKNVKGPMRALLTLPVNTQAMCCIQDETPVSRRQGRLTRSQSMDVDSLYASKRTTREEEDEESKESKRPRPYIKGSPLKRLRRSHSLADAENIMHAVSKLAEIPELIGDTTKFHGLPIVAGQHQDLKSIEASTLYQLMTNGFEDIEQFHIIDCRFPYEYNGGHIMGAKNLYTTEMVEKEFFVALKEVQDKTKRMVLVFHCEFSSERGPARFRDVRRMDRERNTDRYPHLHYPEMYLLFGGYKAFFEQYKELCEPQRYLPMKHKEHKEDLRQFKCSRYFKAKARTFPADGSDSSTLRRSSSSSDVAK